MVRSTIICVALAALAGAGAARAAPCRIEQIAEIRVLPGNRPVFTTRIAGQPVTAILDTGAFSSTITDAAAERLHLRRTPLQLSIVGIGGRRPASVVTLPSFEVGGGAFRNLKMLTTPARLGEIDMLLGRDFLARTDLELDLRHGVVRLLRPQACAGDQMAYWSRTGYAQAALDHPDELDPFRITVKLNGRPVQATIDSGASNTVITSALAEQAHVAVTPLPGSSSGIGPSDVATGAALFGSIAIGDEVVRNTRLEVGDLYRHTGQIHAGSLISQQPDSLSEMLLGADFLQSHRVLISLSHHMVYFTYEGGPVFQPPPADAS